jgi:Tfp pilus assembly protein FimT
MNFWLTMNRRRFTLVELLTVFATIAIQAALLLALAHTKAPRPPRD